VKKTLQPIAVIGIAIVVMAAVSLYMQPRGHDTIPWRTDYAAAKAEAAQSNKPIFLYFTADYCQPCQYMKQTTWASEDVKTVLDAYVPIKVDIEKNKDLAISYGIESIPHFFLIGTDGRIKRDMPRALTPEELIAWVNPPRP